MGKRGRWPYAKTYIVGAIGSLILGGAMSLLYIHQHPDTGRSLPILGGIVLIVVGGGGSFTTLSARTKLILVALAAFGMGAFITGFTA